MHKQFAKIYDEIQRLYAEIMSMNFELHKIFIKANHASELWRRKVDEFHCGYVTLQQTREAYGAYLDYCQEYWEKKQEIDELDETYSALYLKFQDIRKTYLGY